MIQYWPLCLAVLVLHEAAHVTTAYLVGSRITGCGCSWRGMYVRLATCPPKAALVIALAGPLMNILLGLSSPWFPLFGALNLAFGYLNLLPLPWSDSMSAYRAWKQI